VRPRTNQNRAAIARGEPIRERQIAESNHRVAVKYRIAAAAVQRDRVSPFYRDRCLNPAQRKRAEAQHYGSAVAEIDVVDAETCRAISVGHFALGVDVVDCLTQAAFAVTRIIVIDKRIYGDAAGGLRAARLDRQDANGNQHSQEHDDELHRSLRIRKNCNKPRALHSGFLITPRLRRPTRNRRDRRCYKRRVASTPRCLHAILPYRLPASKRDWKGLDRGPDILQGGHCQYPRVAQHQAAPASGRPHILGLRKLKLADRQRLAGELNISPLKNVCVANY
jgi:hypothetical protein